MDNNRLDIGGISINEVIIDGAIGSYKVNNVYYTGQSDFQRIDVVELEAFGKTLILDKMIQSASFDEFIYHENLVYPALLYHKNPKKVLILGGGEGGTSREVLRFKSVEKCVLVDIDKIVIETSKKYLKSHHKGSWDNKRLQVIIGDAKTYLENSNETWDIIISDLADPSPDCPCYLLYTKEFYTMILSKLSTNGIFVTQSGPCSIYNIDEVCIPVYNTLSQVFPYVASYHTHCPSFFDHYSFTIASLSNNVNSIPQLDIENLINEKVSALHEKDSTSDNIGNNVPKAIDNDSIKSSFSQPKWMKKSFMENKEIITDNSPVYLT